MTDKGKQPVKSIYNYLEEDPVIPSQQYFVLSYILPGEKNELKRPMIKFRGAYRTKEECEIRIEKLKNSDNFFNMFVAEAGKWGCLLTDDELNTNEEIEKVYNDDKLNELFKGMKENDDKAKEAEKNRMELLRKKAVEEGKKEFQDYIHFLNENIRDAKFVQTMSADDFDLYKENLENLNGYLEYCKYVRTYLSEEYKRFLEHREDESELEKLVEDITKAINSFMKS